MDLGSFFEQPRDSNLGLKVDEALVTVVSNMDVDLQVFARTSICYGCPFERKGIVHPGGALGLTLNTWGHWDFNLAMAKGNISTHPYQYHQESIVCEMRGSRLGEFGHYEVTITDSSCVLKTVTEPVFIYGGLIMACVFFAALGLGKMCIAHALKRRKAKKVNEEDAQKATLAVSSAQPKSRLRSLDTFRGLAILMMIFVNDGGGRYWFLSHTPWDGLWASDVVFPWFLWIMGVCVPMGVASQLRRNTPKKTVLWRTLVRSVKLVLLGLFLNSLGGHYALETYRIPGVLQRIGMCYLVTTSVYVLFARDPQLKKESTPGLVSDVIILLPQWIVYGIIMAVHTYLVFFMDIPGCPRGYVGPGGVHLLTDSYPTPNCTGGATRAVDLWVLGENHLYQRSTAEATYKSGSFDPEGILGTLPSLVTVFLGIQCGQTLITFKEHKSKLWRLVFQGLLQGIGGFILCSWTLTGGPVPVNKNLWSASFVLVTSSLAFLLLALLYLTVDRKQVWGGSPLFQAGMNSILLYVAHMVCHNVFPFHFTYGNMNTHWALLGEALWGITLWVLLALYLHKKRKYYVI